MSWSDDKEVNEDEKDCTELRLQLFELFNM